MSRRTFLFKFLLCSMGGTVAMPGLAQTTGLLYDPLPPADSAYVRVINVPVDQALSVFVDGSEHVKKLAAGSATDYMVIPAGTHRISLKMPGASEPVLDESLIVTAGRSMTLAYEGKGLPLRKFLDKANTNKAKAVLCAYHLAPRVPTLDIRTADDKLTVFPALVSGTSKCLNVNPIKVSLKAVGDGLTPSTALIDMNYGGTYGVWILPNKDSGVRVVGQVNRVEPYSAR